MRFGYTIIYVEDVTATVEFYEKCFNLKRRFIHESGDYAEMDTGATALAFSANTLASQSVEKFMFNTLNGDPAGIEIALLTEDVSSAFTHAVANGATPVLAPVTKPWGQEVALVRDLNGVLVEIASPMS